MGKVFWNGYYPSCNYGLRRKVNAENRAPEKIPVHSATHEQERI